MVDALQRQAVQQKATGRRERIAIFGGKKSVLGRRSQKGKIFNRRNKKPPKPSTKAGSSIPKPTKNNGSGVSFGDSGDDSDGDDDGDDGDDGGGGSGGEG